MKLARRPPGQALWAFTIAALTTWTRGIEIIDDCTNIEPSDESVVRALVQRGRGAVALGAVRAKGALSLHTRGEAPPRQQLLVEDHAAETEAEELARYLRSGHDVVAHTLHGCHCARTWSWKGEKLHGCSKATFNEANGSYWCKLDKPEGSETGSSKGSLCDGAAGKVGSGEQWDFCWPETDIEVAHKETLHGCHCSGAWEFEGQLYNGCAKVGKGSRWCYVFEDEDLCPDAMISPSDGQRWDYCFKEEDTEPYLTKNGCHCMPQYSINGVSYTGCSDIDTDEVSLRGCVVLEDGEDCGAAYNINGTEFQVDECFVTRNHTADILKTLVPVVTQVAGKITSECHCQPVWRHNGTDHLNCSSTPDRQRPWCYVVEDARLCKKVEGVDDETGQRWTYCAANASDVQAQRKKEKSNPKVKIVDDEEEEDEEGEVDDSEPVPEFGPDDSTDFTKITGFTTSMADYYLTATTTGVVRTKRSQKSRLTTTPLPVAPSDPAAPVASPVYETHDPPRCVTRYDPRITSISIATAPAGTPCIFGLDPRDEGRHCIPDFDYGTSGWCYTRADKDEWGSCSTNCPLYADSLILGLKLDALAEGIDTLSDEIANLSMKVDSAVVKLESNYTREFSHHGWFEKMHHHHDMMHGDGHDHHLDDKDWHDKKPHDHNWHERKEEDPHRLEHHDHDWHHKQHHHEDEEDDDADEATPATPKRHHEEEEDDEDDMEATTAAPSDEEDE
mmetsp:Transcript_64881/g.120712  ORF Transcript_64881/g.120712 Transcript_64881/m.120712 type:complete len:730 (+) Transcript_64881:61-2250(+)